MPGIPPYKLLPTEQHFVRFQSWWRVEDPAWVKRRKEEWKTVKTGGVLMLSGATAKMFQQMGRFYVYGEERDKEDAAAGRSTVAIDGKNRYMLTPFETPGQAQELFEALGTARGKIDTWSRYMNSACHAFDGLACLQHKVGAFANGVLGNEFKVMVAPHSDWLGQACGGDVEITKGRRGWTREYLLEVLQSLDGLRPRRRYSETPRTYSYAIECVSYFLSMLRYMEANGESLDEWITTDQVLEQLADLLTSNDKAHEFQLWQRELADKLREAFEANDAPECIKKAYRKT